MDFSTIFQSANKKSMLVDVVFYFVMSALIAAVLSYLIFLVKDNLLTADINKETAALKTVGTDQQKQEETDVLNYQRKINDFSGLLKNHEFASNVFAFMQTQTMPNVWFKQFSLDKTSGKIQLSGEAESLEDVGRQVSTFEKNKYISSLSGLSTSLGQSSRISFNLTLGLDPSIFTYLSSVAYAAATAPVAAATASPATAPVGQITAASGAAKTAAANGQPAVPPTTTIKSNEKLITSFHIILPETTGIIDETKHTITLNLPAGTNVKNLIPTIVTSPGATVSPPQDVAQDFTSPAIYTVAAQDGSTQNYTVTVNILPGSAAAGAKTSQSSFLMLIIISAGVVVAVTIVVITIIFLSARKKAQRTKTNF